jgi:Family of unknown function (DUF6193)
VSSDGPDHDTDADAGRWNKLNEAEQQAALNVLYPELAADGDLPAAIQAAAAGLAVDLGIVTSGGLNPGGYAVVPGTMPDRKMQISIAVLKRLFMVSGWSRGVFCVNGSTSDLGEVVRAAAAWRRGASLDEMQEAAPFVEVDSIARAHERGPAEYVSESWRLRRQSPRFDDLMRLAAASPTWMAPEAGQKFAGYYRRVDDLIDAAYAVPVLRQLLPFTSHFWVTFSTCTGYPYDRGLPHVRARHSGGYVVVRDGRAAFDFGSLKDADSGGVIGEADDAQSAIAIVVAHLPADIGPARAGTMDDP